VRRGKRRARPFDVLLAGYYGFHNLGDDMLLEATLGLLGKQGVPPERVALLTARPEEAPAGVLPFDRWNPLRIAEAASLSRSLLLGGGGLFQDSTSSKSCLYYWGVVRIGALCGARPWAFGQSVGPFRSALGRLLARDGLRRCDPRTIRDEPSRRELEGFGLSAETAPDLVLSLRPGELPRSGSRIAVNLRPWRGGLVERAAEEVRALLARLGAEGLGIALDPADRDLLEGLRSAGRLPLGEIRLVRSAEEIFAALDGCAGLAAMRLHALVLATVGEVPAYAIPYDPKVEAFAGQFALPSGLAGLRDWVPEGGSVDRERLRRARQDLGEAFARALTRALSEERGG
jgi:polysaccharide pyruvyl transferase CsaB